MIAWIMNLYSSKSCSLTISGHIIITCNVMNCIRTQLFEDCKSIGSGWRKWLFIYIATHIYKNVRRQMIHKSAVIPGIPKDI